MSFLQKYSPPSSSKTVIPLVLLIIGVPSSFETMSVSANNQTNVQNETSGIHTRSSPPTKSLFSSPIFNAENFLSGNSLGTVGGLLKTLGGGGGSGTPFPLRESYIAFEQGHSGPLSSSDPSYNYAAQGQSFDEYFKPSKFPLGLGSSTGFDYGSKLQNTYPSYGYQTQPPAQYKPYYYPLPPPRPPQPSHPFLRLVKIPGDLQLTVTSGGGGHDLEVSCEFPPYLLVVQQIYWHFIPQPSSFLPPYGTFYDLRNGFAPHVTVTPVSKWKSILRVRNYTPDDFGTYRCVSTAILPDEPEPRPTFSPQFSPYGPPTPPQLPAPLPPTYFLNFPQDSIELRSSESKIDAETSQEGGGEKLFPVEKDLIGSPSQRQERKVKFLGRSKREVGAFGVYAPFFKPHYGIYRIYKEIIFNNDAYPAGSDVHENVVNTSKENKDRLQIITVSSGNSNSKINSGKQTKKRGRRYDNDNAVFRRSSKVLF